MLLINRFSIFHHKNFKFADGSSKDKYLITLNCNLKEKEVSVVLTTTPKDSFYNNPNLLYDTVLITKGESKYLPKDCYVDLKNIFVKQWDDLEENSKRGTLEYLGTLEEELAQKIVDAIKNAFTIDEEHKKAYLCGEYQ